MPIRTHILLCWHRLVYLAPTARHPLAFALTTDKKPCLGVALRLLGVPELKCAVPPTHSLPQMRSAFNRWQFQKVLSILIVLSGQVFDSLFQLVNLVAL